MTGPIRARCTCCVQLGFEAVKPVRVIPVEETRAALPAAALQPFRQSVENLKARWRTR